MAAPLPVGSPGGGASVSGHRIDPAGSRRFDPAGSRRWSPSASLVSSLVLGALIAAVLTIAYRSVDHRGMIDLEVYRKGAWAFVHGRSPFGSALPGPGLPYTYTPFSTVVFAPLSLLSLHVAMGAHTFVSLLALFVSLIVVITRLEPDARPRTLLVAGVIAVVAAFFSEPVLQTLGFGQINLVLMAMVLVDLLALRSRRGNGVLVGIATGIKLTPFVFIAYLVVVRRYRAAATAALAAAGTVAVGWAFMPGPSHTYFFDLMWNARRVGNVGYVGNQSLDGLWTRVEHGYLAAKPFWAASAFAVLVLGLWTAARVQRRLGEPAGIAVCAVTGLLVSPISWSHHWVWWVVPALVLGHEAWRRRSRLIALLALAWSIPFYVGPFWFVPHRNHRSFPRNWHQQVQASAYVWLGLLALVVTALAARRFIPSDHGPATDEVAAAEGHPDRLELESRR